MAGELAATMVGDGLGNFESNGITEEWHAFRDEIAGEVWLGDERLAKIVRLRLLTDRMFPSYDLSYCYGVLKDGTNVRVHLPRSQFGKRTIKSEIIEMCKAERVYAKGLGLLDVANVWSVMSG